MITKVLLGIHQGKLAHPRVSSMTALVNQKQNNQTSPTAAASARGQHHWFSPSLLVGAIVFHKGIPINTKEIRNEKSLFFATNDTCWDFLKKLDWDTFESANDD